MEKIGGYIVGILGILFLAASIKPLNAVFVSYIPQLKNIATYYLLGAGIIIILVALVLLRSSGSGKQPPEVPIYQGKNVVGFRRMGKKRR
jgi:hypothetical protein